MIVSNPLVVEVGPEHQLASDVTQGGGGRTCSIEVRDDSFSVVLRLRQLGERDVRRTRTVVGE
jgi:hypothetical protein